MCMHIPICLAYLSGFGGAPTGLHSNTLPGSASDYPQDGDDFSLSLPSIIIMLGIFSPDWPVMERKASDY